MLCDEFNICLQTSLPYEAKSCVAYREVLLLFFCSFSVWRLLVYSFFTIFFVQVFMYVLYRGKNVFSVALFLSEFRTDSVTVNFFIYYDNS